MSFFGKSALKSLRNGMPNMNVLIAVGATAAFVYSLYGTLTGRRPIICFMKQLPRLLHLVFLGNYLEDASIAFNTKSIEQTGQITKSNGQYDRF